MCIKNTSLIIHISTTDHERITTKLRVEVMNAICRDGEMRQSETLVVKEHENSIPPAALRNVSKHCPRDIALQ